MTAVIAPILSMCLAFIIAGIVRKIYVETGEMVLIEHLKEDWTYRLPFRLRNNRYRGLSRPSYQLLAILYYFAKAIDVRGTNPYGNAILSRYPILSAQAVMIPDPAVRMADNDDYETRCLLKAYIDIPGGLCVCVTHFGLNPDEQENAVQTVLEQTEQKRCVLMGDFNVTPENPLLDALREKMTDTGELLAPGTCSYPSDAPDIKIDYMFISKDLKAVSAEIPDVQESDHRPYVTVLEA